MGKAKSFPEPRDYRVVFNIQQKKLAHKYEPGLYQLNSFLAVNVPPPIEAEAS